MGDGVLATARAEGRAAEEGRRGDERGEEEEEEEEEDEDDEDEDEEDRAGWIRMSLQVLKTPYIHTSYLAHHRATDDRRPTTDDRRHITVCRRCCDAAGLRKRGSIRPGTGGRRHRHRHGQY
jgi:hypothetical protein